MKPMRILVFAVCLLVIGSSPGWSATIGLFDWAFNVDGVTYEDVLGDSMPTEGTLNDEGLGTLTWTTSEAGNHSFIAFFDHEIGQADNGFFNEYGLAVNTPEASQSWEIDEPGYLFGDIYDNLENGALDNTNNVPSGFGDDVSWAMGWDFFLAADETATISLVLGDIAPASGFYLSQTDPESRDQDDNVVPETIYFSSSLDITGSTTPIPEPGTLLLWAGLLGILGMNRKKKLH